MRRVVSIAGLHREQTTANQERELREVADRS